MKIGLITECQPDGPDEKVLRCLLAKFAASVEVEVNPTGSKQNLLRDCGSAASQLVKDGCEIVFILWDLHPADWGDAVQQKDRKPCLHRDRERIFEAVDRASVPRTHVYLVAIKYMLETWFLADPQAVAAYLTRKTRKEITAQDLGSINHKTANKPKDRLSDMFQENKCIMYRDFNDAHGIAQEVTELKRLVKCDSFKRFWNKVSTLTNVTSP